MRGLTAEEWFTLDAATNGDCRRSRVGPRIQLEIADQLIARGLMMLVPCDRCKRRHLHHTDLGRLTLRLPRLTA